jgi:hypothetical protein
MSFLKECFLNGCHLNVYCQNKILLLTILVLTLLTLSTKAKAEESHVFCYDSKHDTWEWLDDDVRVHGDYLRHFLYSQNKFFYYMDISASQYEKLKALCLPGYIPQPAFHSYSRWSVFRVTDGQQSKFVEGKRTYYPIVNYFYLN